MTTESLHIPPAWSRLDRPYQRNPPQPPDDLQDLPAYQAATIRRPRRAEARTARSDLREAGSPGGEKGGAPFSYGHIAGRSTSENVVRIYPEGLEIQRLASVKPARAPKSGIRGEISGFSKASERRLRRQLLGSEVPGSRRYDMTFTVPGPLVDDDDFRRIMNGFKCRSQRKGVAGFWRVELQKRDQPHLHCLMWLPQGVSDSEVCADWLASCDVLGRCDWKGKNGRTQRGKLRSEISGAQKWASKSREGVGNYWFRYMVQHTTKKKEEQLGWKGKQWGKFNGPLIVPIHPDIFVASDRIFNMLVRTIRRHQNRPAGFMITLERGVRPTPSRRLPSHFGRAGTWVRYMPPDVMLKLVNWVRTLDGASALRASNNPARTRAQVKG